MFFIQIAFNKDQSIYTWNYTVFGTIFTSYSLVYLSFPLFTYFFKTSCLLNWASFQYSFPPSSSAGLEAVNCISIILITFSLVFYCIYLIIHCSERVWFQTLYISISSWTWQRPCYIYFPTELNNPIQPIFLLLFTTILSNLVAISHSGCWTPDVQPVWSEMYYMYKIHTGFWGFSMKKYR